MSLGRGWRTNSFGGRHSNDGNREWVAERFSSRRGDSKAALSFSLHELSSEFAPPFCREVVVPDDVRRGAALFVGDFRHLVFDEHLYGVRVTVVPEPPTHLWDRVLSADLTGDVGPGEEVVEPVPDGALRPVARRGPRRRKEIAGPVAFVGQFGEAVGNGVGPVDDGDRPRAVLPFVEADVGIFVVEDQLAGVQCGDFARSQAPSTERDDEQALAGVPAARKSARRDREIARVGVALIVVDGPVIGEAVGRFSAASRRLTSVVYQFDVVL